MPPSSPALAVNADPARALYRSGVAARLAGIPPQTLRVWEHRYRVVDPDVSAGGQRLYSESDVARLRLIKTLVDSGYAIGSVARQSAEVLAAMRRNEELTRDTASPAAGGESWRLALIGPMVSALELTVPHARVIRRHADVDAAEAAPAGEATTLAVFELATLSERDPERIARLRERMDARHVVVLYRFAPAPLIRRLRLAGCDVMRAPSDAAQIEAICRSVLQQPTASMAVATSSLEVAPAHFKPAPDVAQALPPPRYRTADLVRVATGPSAIYCECPKQVAELLISIAAFERYSAECANRGPEDAALHRGLNRAAGEARLIMEQAMARLAEVDNLSLPRQ